MPATDPISTRRRVEYALGYLGLGLLKDATAELEAIGPADRFSLPVLAAWLQLHTAAGSWGLVANYANLILRGDRKDVQAWVSLGCAVRRIKDVAAARDVLLEARPLVGDHAIIHFNLACYHCLLGELDAAKACLAKACRMDPSYKIAALHDPDLKDLRPGFAGTH